MLELIRDLMMVITTITGYPASAEPPAVHVVADAELQQMACGKPCWVKAFYDPDKGVFVSKSVDFEHDTYGRSILLHELVHHAQRVSGRFESAASPCERRNAEELEAYEVQNRYLSSRSDPRTIPIGRLSLKCE